MYKKYLSLILALTMMSAGTAAFADDETEAEETYATGLAEMTDEEWESFNSRLPMITNVKPNNIALSRTETDTESEVQLLGENDNISPVDIGDEMTYSFPGQGSGGGAQSEFPLTSAVDVSNSLTFPPIGNQGDINSCVPWSLCYYQLTNNNCVARGLNAKTASGTAVRENIMSPGFTYPLINGGQNAATYYNEACAAIMSYGCPNVNDYSETMTTNNIKQWCTSSEVWNNAIYNKPQKITFGTIDTSSTVDGDTDGVVNIKRILSNGYVVTVPVYFDAFMRTNNTTTGAWGCKYAKNLKQGGHALTIVGYDDNFWVDVNGNGRKERTEYGAFKVANSWGTRASKHTKGYLWISYDALGSQSRVSDAPTSRQPVFDCYYFIEPQKDYTPLLIANVTMKTNKRNQVAVKLGVSFINSTTPNGTVNAVDYYHIAFNTAANSYIKTDVDMLDKNFSGGNGQETITVPFDLTPVIKKVYGSSGLAANSDIRLYVEVTDGVSNGSTVTLGNVKVIEPITGKEIASGDSSELVADNSSVMKTVNFKLTPFVGYSSTQDIALTFNSNLKADSLSGNIYIKTPENVIVTPDFDVADGNKIEVYSPEADGNSGYKKDRVYELHVGTQLKSMGGNHLSSEQTIYIYILNRFYTF